MLGVLALASQGGRVREVLYLADDLRTRFA